MSLPAEVLEEISVHVRGGFESPERVFEVFQSELYAPGDWDPDLLRAAIAEAFSRHERDKLSWPETTDCDRLDACFRELNDHGVVSLQNAGFTQSDGYDDFLAVYERLSDPDAVVGYCFFHWQDLEKAIQGEGLHLAFGPANPKEEETGGVRVGHQVAEVFRRAGFTVDWPGTFAKRILIPGFDWKKR